MEARAGQWSEGCRFEHQMRGYGENLAFMSSTGPAPRPRETIMDGIRNWYNEISLWQRRSPQQRLQFCGAACHYTQVIDRLNTIVDKKSRTSFVDDKMYITFCLQTVNVSKMFVRKDLYSSIYKAYIAFLISKNLTTDTRLII